MKKLMKKLVLILTVAACMSISFITVNAMAATMHTVTFMYGDKVNVQQVKHGGNAVLPTDFNVDGYIFNGWTASPANITEDRVLIGMYTKKTIHQLWYNHPVHFVPNSSWPINTYGLNISKQYPTIKINDNLSAPAPEWWKDLKLPEGDATTVCSVRWFNGWTGELWKVDMVPFGYTYPDPGNPCIDGWEFIGWEGSWENITEDRNIKAWYYIKPAPEEKKEETKKEDKK